MARKKWIQCRETGELIEVDLEPKPVLAGPVILQDSCDPTWHPVNGKTYDSKSAFRAVTKAAGYEEYGHPDAIKPVEYEPPDGHAESLIEATNTLKEFEYISNPKERMERAILEIQDRHGR